VRERGTPELSPVARRVALQRLGHRRSTARGSPEDASDVAERDPGCHGQLAQGE
jgi:hypothetical protein